MPDIQLSNSYIRERDRIRAEIDAASKDIDSLGFPWRGLAKIGYALIKAIGVPILAVIASTSHDMGEGIKAFASGEATEIKIKRDDKWWQDIFRRFGYTDKEIDALSSLIAEAEGGPVWFPMFFLCMMLVNLFGNIGHIASARPYKNLMARFSPNTPQPGEIIKGSFIDPTKHDRIVKAMHEAGMSDNDIELLFLAQYALQDIGTIRDIYYRTGKDVSWLDNRLSELGFTPTRITELKSVFPILPSMQDMVTFMAKEAFEPDQQAMYGLGAEYPDELTKYAALNGLEPEWAFRYWVSHWVHPSYNQVMEMYHRGVISYDQVYNWFRLVEIPPFWRDALTKIAHTPFTRVDIRRMYDLGLMTEEEVIQAHKDIGYDDVKARKLTEFVKNYTLENDRDLTRTDITKAYTSGYIDSVTALNLLKMSGFNQDYAEFILYMIDKQNAQNELDDQVTIIKDLHTKLLIDETESRKRLALLGFSNSQINQFIEKWKPARTIATAMPSKTDLEKLYKAGVIDSAAYTEEMTRLGYAPKYVSWFMALMNQQAGG
jgi:hypothetical protein